MPVIRVATRHPQRRATSIPVQPACRDGGPWRINSSRARGKKIAALCLQPSAKPIAPAAPRYDHRDGRDANHVSPAAATRPPSANGPSVAAIDVAATTVGESATRPPASAPAAQPRRRVIQA